MYAAAQMRASDMWHSEMSGEKYMTLLHCPECAHEVSVEATACPNCGRPIGVQPLPVVVERKVIVSQVPRESSFPPWAIVPIVLLALVLLVVGVMVFRQSGEQANTNISVNLAGKRPGTESSRETRTTTVPSTESQPASIPPSQTTTVPGTTTTVPNMPPPNKGTVKLSAKVAPASGAPQAARGTRFYLLDKDVESILSEARIDPIEGNTLAASLGLAAVFPARYGQFQRAAMSAISKHVKYSGTTGSSGNADIKGIEPASYYLFAITRASGGFALWNQSVSVIAGDNVMNLSPQSITEVPDPNG